MGKFDFIIITTTIVITALGIYFEDTTGQRSHYISYIALLSYGVLGLIRKRIYLGASIKPLTGTTGIKCCACSYFFAFNFYFFLDTICNLF